MSSEISNNLPQNNDDASHSGASSPPEPVQEQGQDQVYKPVHISKFEDAGLKDSLLRGIYKYGWDTPSIIQRQGIPAILTRRDVIMQAQSGMGKTGTFTVSLLQVIDETQPTIQGVILVPTRELADQVYKVIQALGDEMEVNFVKCVGKTRVSDNLAYPDRATVLVGTPGKLSDVFKNRLIKSQKMDLKCFIIDEFDKMLEANDFVDTIQDLFQFLNSSSQIVLSSATVSNEVLKIADKFMRNPIDIAMKTESLTLEGLQQYHIDCQKEEWKFDTILDLYQTLVIAQSIIFVNSKRRCEDLEDRFNHAGFSVQSIHGGMEQNERDSVMEAFRAGRVRILLSTDLTARGIDVPGISLVINYDLPKDNAQYLHRVGRSARFGKKGSSINLLASKYDIRRMEDIEKHYNTQIKELPKDFAQLIN